jgi:S-adenosylmethionine synthetase
MGGIYLTVLGTSADDGDCGQVGRGNRVNGIIPLNRPTSSEAAAGKNPVSHIGKIYNILSYKMAEKIYQEIPGIKEVYVWLLSEIGQPINQPKIASAQLILDSNVNFSSISKQVEEIIQTELSQIDRFCESLVKERYEIC